MDRFVLRADVAARQISKKLMVRLDRILTQDAIQSFYLFVVAN